jgi:microcompartment protein CcmL/EutN
MIFGPAIASFELSSIARGYFLLDKLVKKAPVKILEAAAVSPGKFFILINGDEASVEESRKELLALAANQIIDEVYIPFLHPEVLPGMYSQNRFPVVESVGIVETAAVSSGLVSADRACKGANVHLIDFRMARGIGGKAYYFVTGTLENVEASVADGVSAIVDKGTLIRTEIIANPHEDFLKYFNVEGAL